MALYLYRLPRSVIRLNQLKCSRVIIVASTSQVDSRAFSTQRLNPNSSNKRLKNILTCAIFALSGFGYFLYRRKDDLREQIHNLRAVLPSVRTLSAPPLNVGQNRQKFNFIADVVEISAAAVVYIEIIDKRKLDFFTGKPIPASNGSGFIVAQDGLILTNAHVVINKPNTIVRVRLFDGTVYTGVVEDVDMHSDLATVRINKTNLPVMKLGSSNNIRPGEFVVAIGSPLSLSNTITSGVISSVHRPSQELGIFHKQMNYLQTDAAITQFGNSGGPLVNLDGEAIGINSMKVTAGISFAIPIDYAKEFLYKAEQRRKGTGAADIKEDSKRRYLGITMVSLTPDLLFEIQQRSGQIPDFVRHGVLIYKVVFGSPAHMGGLLAGDIMTHVNGEEVHSAMTVYQALEKPGKLILTIVRNTERLSVTVNPEDI